MQQQQFTRACLLLSSLCTFTLFVHTLIGMPVCTACVPLTIIVTFGMHSFRCLHVLGPLCRPQAERPDQPLRVYLMTYNNSIEQYKYRSEIQREIDVFTELIENKGKINIPLDIGQDAGAGPSLHTGVDELYMGVGAGSSAARNAITRRAGGRRGERAVPRRVVVDMREFMSSLPAVLHQRGFEIAPMTLEVKLCL